ncbi:hypothetical protein [Anoxybacteroides tepidamans]|uniref:hypothetical protein n=1 Tax=Anoxybacteroides tepidamans TaxID=265948 RepID=UPI000480B053|nr:hypothetical protein [Anoxybacillus tepidamans]
MEEQKQTHEQASDRFSRLMFGNFPRQQTENTARTDTLPSGQGVDFIKLMEDIDTLVSSFNRLKPLMKTFNSFGDLFKK